ncbi:hypothetical protein JCM10207_006789 [Rhodosporidiobolus poonsookiae]
MTLLHSRKPAPDQPAAPPPPPPPMPTQQTQRMTGVPLAPLKTNTQLKEESTGQRTRSRLLNGVEDQLREQALYYTGATICAVAALSITPFSSPIRAILVILIGSTGLYFFSLRSRALLLDYRSVLPTPSPSSARDLPPVTPSSGFSPFRATKGPASPSPGKDDEGAGAEQPQGTQPESASWLNTLLAPLWPIVDRQLLVAVVDLIEDALKAECPPIVHSVRLTSLSPGSHPVRVLSIRASNPSTPSPSASSPSASAAPPKEPFAAFAPPASREERNMSPGEEEKTATTTLLNDPSEVAPAPWAADRAEEGRTAAAAQASASAGLGGRGGGGADLRQTAETGPFVELEIEFGYRRAVALSEEDAEKEGRMFDEEGKGAEGRGEGGQVRMSPLEAERNINFVAYLGVGVSKLLTVPLPILVSLTHIRGALLLRLQLVPEPPFVKTVGFALKGMPGVELSAFPLHARLDVMTLPLLNSYILSAMRRVMQGFVYPRHYALDVRKLLMGGDVALKTRTVGLAVLVLHRARSLPASDPRVPFLHPSPAEGGEQEEGKKRRRREGKSDPFVTVGWAGEGKVLFKSKIVPASLDPVWEELCFVRVPVEPIEDGSRIRLTVIDHDRFNPNDTLGYHDVSVSELASRPGEWVEHRQAGLVKAQKREKGKGAEEGEGGGGARGEIEYSVAYFPLCEALPAHLQPDKPPPPEGEPDPLVDEELGERAQEEPEAHERRKKARLDRLDELLNARHPAPLSHPSGVLSLQIHQIADLDLPNKSPGPVRSAVRAAIAPGQTKAMRKSDLPSSYVQAFLDDECVYRTRLKPFTNAPYFNAGAELFLRDWTTGQLTLAVMDYRDRAEDVVAGFVEVDLGETLREKCQVTKWFPIIGGAGSGRLRASVLFKPLAMDIPRGLREWSLGTLEIVSAHLDGIQQGENGRLKFRIHDGEHAETGHAEAEGEGPLLTFDLSSHPARLPVLSRIAPVEVAFESRHGLSVTKGKGRGSLHGVFSMSEVVRGEKGVRVRVELSEDVPLVVPDSHELPKLSTASPSSDDASEASPPAEPSTPLADEASSSAPSFPPPLALSVHAASAPASAASHTSSSAPPCPTLTLHLRWHPGFSPLHASLVLSGSSAHRSAYQLYVHKRTHRADMRREQRAAREAGVAVPEFDHAAGADEWESDDARTATDEDEAAAEDELDTLGQGRKRRKGGTLRWVKQSAKVAARRVRNAGKHKTGEPAPETEMQSAL